MIVLKDMAEEKNGVYALAQAGTFPNPLVLVEIS
jgi:hypothetical protein